MDLQNDANGHEGKFIRKIVKEVREKLDPRVLSMPVYSIGIDSRAKSILSWLNDGSRDVGMLAICGMGGLGKTTIAKFVYNNHIQSRFQNGSFLANIAQQNDLTVLQTQLLLDITGREERVNNVDEGIVKIQNALKCKCVLLVLDDVGTREHLEAMVGNCDWLHTGSKIIITTRNKELIRAHKSCVAYELQILNPCESLELFSWHAFRQNKRDYRFMEISQKLVNLFEGLPLAICIMGSTLLGRSLSIWKDTYKKLVAFSNPGIHEKLKISFDLLDNHDKELFLHVACFFLGYNKDRVAAILEGCGFCTTVGFQTLIDKCLLTILSKSFGEEKKLEMHQLVREMGREIVRQESLKDPGNRSRIWNKEDSLRILEEKSGTAKIEGLILNIQKSKNRNLDGNKKHKFLDAFNESFLHSLGNWVTSTTSRSLYEVAFETEAFAKMCNLKLLMINYVQLNGNYKNFPKDLRWLSRHGSPLQSIPGDLCLKRLVILEMPYSSLGSVWTGSKNFNYLKILNLSDSYNLTKTPDFSLAVNLEKLILENCTRLVEIHESIELLEKLVSLNLRNCVKLSNIPRSIDGLNLQTLDISGCTNLVGWSRWLENMKSLQVFNADGVGQYSSTSFRPFKSNKSFRVAFTYLPASLEHLSLVACNLRDDAFPANITKMSSLKYLNLSKNLIRSLPDCFTHLTKLEDLILNSCTELRSITALSTECLENLDLKECRLLEKITSLLLSDSYVLVDYNGCESLAELFNHFKVEPIENVDEEIINNLCVSNWEYLEITNIKIYQYRSSGMHPLDEVGPSVNQQCYSIYRGGSRHRIGDYGDMEDMEFNIFSTYFPGSEVPEWYNFREEGSSMYLNVPCCSDNITIQGLNVCFVYALPYDCDKDNGFAGSYPFRTYVTNCSRRTIFHNGDRWFSGVSKTSQDMIDLSYWKFKHDELKCGDVLFIKVQEEEFGRRIKLKVKEIGVRILFSEHEEKSLQYVSREEFEEISTITLRQSFSTTKSLNIPLQVGYLIEHSFQRHLTEYHLESEVPRWCEFRSRGPSIELPMPLYQDSLSGLQVCVIYTLLHHYQDIYYDDGEGTSINNKSTDGFWNNMYKWVIGDTKTTQDIMELSYMTYFGWESSDKVRIEVRTNNEYFKVKEIGVQIIHEDDELQLVNDCTPHKLKENRVQIIYEESKGGLLSPEVCVIGEPNASMHNYNPENYKFVLNTDVNVKDFADGYSSVAGLRKAMYERLFKDFADSNGFMTDLRKAEFERVFKDFADRNGLVADLRKAVYGGVFRDGEGKWILGYYGRMRDVERMAQYPYHLRKSDYENIIAKWAIYKGLTIILEKGWSNILIQTTYWPAVEDLYNITTSNVETPLEHKDGGILSTLGRMVLKDISFLRSRCNCTLSYFFPKEDKLAKLIAELGKGTDDELVVLENPPDDLEIKDILSAKMKM